MGPRDVQIAVTACAICHSDIHYADGAWGGQLPAVYGHEASGVVTEVGPQVTQVNGLPESVAACIQRQAAKWRFGPHDTPTRVSYPFIFKAQ